MRRTVSTSSTEDQYRSRRNRRTNNRSRHRPREKTSRRSGLSSKLSQSSQSLSSAENSRSRASSPCEPQRVRRSHRKHHNPGRKHHGDVSRESTQKKPAEKEPAASEDAVNVPRLLGAAAAKIISHSMQSNPPRKEEANESQESIPLSAKTASATSLHLPQIFEAASKIIGHSKNRGSRKTQALEIGKEILQDVFAQEPEASRSTPHPSRSPHDVLEANVHNGSRQGSIDNPGPTASNASTKPIQRERKPRSPLDGPVPERPRRNSESTYRHPTVHEENSDLTAERPDGHRDRQNRKPADRPSAEKTARKTGRASPEDHGEQMDARTMEFVPFPESTGKSYFNFGDDPFANSGSSLFDPEFAAIWGPPTPNDPDFLHDAAIPRFFDEDS